MEGRNNNKITDEQLMNNYHTQNANGSHTTALIKVKADWN